MRVRRLRFKDAGGWIQKCGFPLRPAGSNLEKLHNSADIFVLFVAKRGYVLIFTSFKAINNWEQSKTKCQIPTQ